MEIMQEKNQELGYRLLEINQYENRVEKKRARQTKRASETYGTISKDLTCVIEILKGEERDIEKFYF